MGLSIEAAPIAFKELIWKEGKIRHFQVSHGEFAKAIDQLANCNRNPEPQISEIRPVEEIQKAFELLESNPEKYLKILIDFNAKM